MAFKSVDSRSASNPGPASGLSSLLKIKSDRRSSCGLLSTLDSARCMVTVMNVCAYYINNQIDILKKARWDYLATNRSDGIAGCGGEQSNCYIPQYLRALFSCLAFNGCIVHNGIPDGCCYLILMNIPLSCSQGCW